MAGPFREMTKAEDKPRIHGPVGGQCAACAAPHVLTPVDRPVGPASPLHCGAGNVSVGSKCEELNVSKSSPLYPTMRTSTMRAHTSQGPQAGIQSSYTKR